MTMLRRVFLCAVCVLAAPSVYAQVQTGSIVGEVTDSSGAVLPGVTVSLTGERLIGGVQSFVTDAGGTYRFDRLPPGTYTVKFELEGFKVFERKDVVINASFVATINARLEVGALTETILVAGESPTVDTKSNLQQTVMSQEILEGIPTGRDPWSLARLIPGVQVSTYDVGGTQSMQQSGLSSHGSNGADVSFNIDGAAVNWPGGGGGSTMLYYDQGMFEEVNYMTSAIPAEVMAGGLSINMVTKTAGNLWRGNVRYSFSNDDLQAENHLDIQQRLPSFLGNPTLKTYDFNVSGGGAIVKDRIWVNGTVRKWVVNKLTNAKNLDGSQALDDNDLKNYSGKGTISISQNQKVMVSYLWNNKIRGHRRDSNDLIPDIAAVYQTNPASTTQVKYNAIRRRLVFESAFSIMDGVTNYLYQPGTPADAIRKVDNTIGSADFASNREEHQPNSRTEFDNSVSYNASAMGEHLFKGGVQWGRLFFEQDYTVQGHHHVEYDSGTPTRVRLFNTPTDQKNLAHVLGLFVQDNWSVGSRLTLNLGFRYDGYKGIIPEESAPGGPFIEARTIDRREVMDQQIGVWRAGMVWDLRGNGLTAVKASYSRYGLQTGIDRVTAVNPLSPGSKTCPWTDPNKDGKFQTSEINFAQCSAFSGGITTFYATDGIDWPYSDEATAGVERQIMRDMRVGAMFYYRTNRKQLGVRNVAVPTSSYTPFTYTFSNGPGGTVANPKPTTVTVYNLAPALVSAANNIRDNQDYLNTNYKGVEFTAAKRMSRNWQMVAGLTIGKNQGGVGGELNDPNTTNFPRGIIGNDSKFGFRLSGSYRLPAEITIAGSLVSNTGYPYTSSASVSRAQAAAVGVALTRSSQSISLSERGEERLPSVTLLDLRLSRRFRFAGRSFSPQLDLFNITNAATVVSLQNTVGVTYLDPREIVAPRIIRAGFSLDF